MTMKEIVDQVSFELGLPANDNVEELQVEQAVLIAFRELKRYIKTPVEKTVPFATRIKLSDVGIYTKKVLKVMPSYPRIGLTLSSIDSGNVFQVAAAVNTYSAVGNTSSINIDPIVTEMGMAQVRNALSTDFQADYDSMNDVVYCTHKDPRPAAVTVRYVPDLQDVSGVGAVLADAIIAYREAAGGFTRRSQLLEIPGIGETLAARIMERFYIPDELPEEDPPAPQKETKTAPAEPQEQDDTEPEYLMLDLNTAQKEDLLKLPDMTDELAEKILSLRERLGGYQNVHELLLIEGMKPEYFEYTLKEHFYIE